MVIRMPDDVQLILDKLKGYGSIGYIVGGCVRDALLGKKPDDWDICTPLKPDIVKKVFSSYQVIETGIKHGTVTVVINGLQYEITTFRIDGKYSDSRHPDNVYFTDSLKDDLGRRDFTMNALAYNPETGIIDYFNGIGDIEQGIVKCVGDAKARFTEDPLRVLRALRFACVLNFDIDLYTLKMVSDCIPLIKNVSKERICAELSKMFKTGSFIRLHQYLSHYWAVILSTLFESTEIPVKVSDETLKSLLYSKDDLILRLALVFRDYDAEVADVMKSLRFDNATIKDVYNLVCRKENYKYVLLDDQDDFGYITRRYIAVLGYDQTERLLDYWQAIVTVKYNLARFTYLSSIEEMRKQVAETREKKFCCTVKDLDITGDDLIQIGFKQGDSIGKVLNILLDKVLKMPFMNKKNWLIEWARKSKEDQAIMQDSN